MPSAGTVLLYSLCPHPQGGLLLYFFIVGCIPQMECTSYATRNLFLLFP